MSHFPEAVLRKAVAMPTLITLLAFAIGAGSVLMISTPTDASSSPNFTIRRSFYSNPAKTNLVGVLNCNCQGNESATGQVTPYFTDQITGFCSGF